ncbi:MAG TPA: DsbA family protein [Stellaceae bacterium]|nr:DsbA family protein [Stellaceae bacterium]
MPLCARVLLSALCCVILACRAAGAAEPSPVAPEQRRAIETIVHDYLLSHPEVLVQALNEAEKKLSRDAQDNARQALTTHRREIFDDPATPVGGNPNGDVTVVEFFDYSCPYCKAVEPSLERLLAQDRGLRFVYKEFPVLGPESVMAARAALAARRQGKYTAFHDAMMTAKGRLDDDKIYRTASAVGLDVARLRRDMAEPQVAAELKDNLALANILDVHGTPTFIIGKEIVPGAIDPENLERLIAAAREKK